MRNLFFLVLLVVSQGGCAPGVQGDGGSGSDGPVMFAEQLDHNFGEVFAGAVKTAKFAFENRGSSNLVIARALKDCGCTRPSFDKKILAPGESGVMTVTLLVPIYHGHLNKRIRVFTNDPKHEETIFNLKLKGLGKANLTPQSINFGDNTKMSGPELVRTLELQMPPDRPILSVSANPESPYVHVRLRGATNAGQAEVEIVFSGLREKVKFRDYLLLNIRTKNEAGKEITVQPQGVQISGYLTPQISASQTMVELGVVRKGDVRPIELQILGSDGATIKRVALEGPEGLAWKKSKSQRLRVRGSLSIDGPEGRLFATLRVELDNGAMIDLPIKGWVESRL